MKNLLKGIWFQIRHKDWFRNIFITRNAIGIFWRHSHTRKDGVDKQVYNTLASANKAAESMNKKYDGKFVAYKCCFCNGFHVGKQLK